ncbi:DNL zinc finger-domain-containing protein [Cunninghamella echinulata]|nr:DNL zinc finger-domain-containing protein [Cunninghamella echinulata]
MLRSVALPFIRSNRCITNFPKLQIATTQLLTPKKLQQSTRSFYGSIYKQREHHLNNNNIDNKSSNKERNDKEEPKAEVLNPKHQLFIGFTCKVCEVRSHHVMSKQAYTKGVVLIQCPDCKNRHLIADNLGWFRDEKTNVEDLVKEKGEAIRKIIVDDQGQKLPVEHLMEWIPEEEAKIQQADEKKSSSLKNDKEN